MKSMNAWLSTGVALAALVVLGTGCFGGTGSGENHNDAQVATDGQVGADGQTHQDATVSADASTAGEGTISIYLQGDHTPKTFTDGLSGQTPTHYVIALSEYWVQTSLDDPAPVFCFDTGSSPVEADMSEDTLVGVCQTADVPTAVYTHGRVKVEWATYTVTGTLHYQGTPLPGEFTFFRAYSDTTYQGQPYLAGEGTITFTGATQVSIPASYDPPLTIPGMRTETIDGDFWMTFPYSRPLFIDQTNTDHHWARFHWEIYEGYRWQDTTDAGHTPNTWDVGLSVPETEPVHTPGVTGYHTTASTD
jgi:hypothetical protein